MNDPYKDTVGAIAEANRIDEAFREILRLNFQAARRALAAAQVDHFGQKPWTRSCPTHDALDRPIVYRDADGMRYYIDVLEPDGSHARVLMFAPDYTGVFDQVEVRAPSPSVGLAILQKFLDKRHLGENDYRTSSSYALQNGWLAIRFFFGKRT